MLLPKKHAEKMPSLISFHTFPMNSLFLLPHLLHKTVLHNI